jgi:hypothetical protein
VTTVKTQLGTVESARRERVEPTGGITATNVQKALEALDAGKVNAGAIPPISASYVTTASEAALPGARRLTTAAALTLSDGGAGATLAVDIAPLGVTTAKIAASAVTYGKMQNASATTLIGNPTGAPAAPAEVTLGSTLTFNGGALQTAAHTGDVTTAANSFATTIANGAVANAKMASMANQTVKGNMSGGTAAPSDLNADQVFNGWFGSTQGSILYRNATDWVALGPGSNGQVLTSGGAGANLSWTTAAGSGTVNAAAWGLVLGGGGATLGIATSNPPYGFGTPINLQLNASVASNLLTVAVKSNNGSDPSATNPVLIPFRDTTQANGDPVWVAVTAALSINTNATGATLGSANSTPFRFWVVAFNNGGSAVLALINCLTANGPVSLDASTLQSTTAISGSAISTATFYTPNGTTLTSKAFCVLGYVEYTSGLATAGTYSAAPDIVQLHGRGISLPGTLVQSQGNSTGALATDTSGNCPGAGDSIMTNSQGSQFMSQAITPRSASNYLEVDFRCACCACGTNGYWNFGIFQDSTTNSLSQKTGSPYGTINIPIIDTVFWRGQAKTASSTTFKVRGGLDRAGNFYFNGASGNRIGGGNGLSWLVVKEYQG